MEPSTKKLMIFVLILLTVLGAVFLMLETSDAADLVMGSNNPTLRWDHNDPMPEGYRVFERIEGAPYDYTKPVYQGSENVTPRVEISPNVVHYFVVRAYLGDLESPDSEEVSYLKITALTPPGGFTINNTGTVIININPAQ